MRKNEPESREQQNISLNLLESILLSDSILGEHDQKESIFFLRVTFALGLVGVMDFEELKRVRRGINFALNECGLMCVFSATLFGILDFLDLTLVICLCNILALRFSSFGKKTKTTNL